MTQPFILTSPTTAPPVSGPVSGSDAGPVSGPVASPVAASNALVGGVALAGDDIPAPSDPAPTPPKEIPEDAPQEAPDAPAPDLPPEPPQEAPVPPDAPHPDDLPGPQDVPPDAPIEVPGSPAPDLPPGDLPSEMPTPSDPTPTDLPQEIPTNPGLDRPISLRPASPLDAGKLGDIITQAVLANTWKPRLRSSAEDIAAAGQMIDKGWITLATLDDQTAGFIAREGDYIHSLYIAEFAQGNGVGHALLNHAKAACDRLNLWTYQQNRGAQRFYRREGFQPTQETEGAHNDEGLPDIQFVWTSDRAAKSAD